MDNTTKEQLTIKPYPCQYPEIGRCLWAMQDIRSRTMEMLQDLTQPQLDWRPSETRLTESSIGSVLYHIGLIEADWLFVEVLEKPFPAEVVALFPHDDRDAQGRLTHVEGDTLDEHIARLQTVRRLLLKAYEEMDLDDYRKTRLLPSYDVSPEWVLHHLMHHEAQHFGQIGTLVTRMQAQLAQPLMA